jgi:hypothetical protein
MLNIKLSGNNTCPYNSLPTNQFYNGEITRVDGPEWREEIDSLTVFSAYGSCFANNIGRTLLALGLPFIRLNPNLASGQFFSAPVGNQYTTSQFLQTFKLAEQTLDCENLIAKVSNSDSHHDYIDISRPLLGKYITAEDALSTAREIYRDVRLSICESDVTILTLGLTEGWRLRHQHTVTPVAPGCGWGEYTNDWEFFEESISTITSNLVSITDILLKLNPKIKIVFTISPIPLSATYRKSNALSANLYSKSKLFVALNDFISAAKNSAIYYFPSFELARQDPTISFNYKGKRNRDISEELITSIMNSFLALFQNLKATTRFTSENGSCLVSTRDICDEDVYFSNLLESSPRNDILPS